MVVPMKELYPLAGVVAIPRTPFDDDDRIDVDSLARGIADRLAAGVDGLLYPAAAGEVSKLTAAERREVTVAVLDRAAGLVPVIIGAGADDVRTVRTAEIGWRPA
jgi:4-hydroxy-tetrahydrodipicolinate synthase